MAVYRDELTRGSDRPPLLPGTPRRDRESVQRAPQVGEEADRIGLRERAKNADGFLSEGSGERRLALLVQQLREAGEGKASSER